MAIILIKYLSQKNDHLDLRVVLITEHVINKCAAWVPDNHMREQSQERWYEGLWTFTAKERNISLGLVCLPVTTDCHTLVDTVSCAWDDVVEFIGHPSWTRHVSHTNKIKNWTIEFTIKLEHLPAETSTNLGPVYTRPGWLYTSFRQEPIQNVASGFFLLTQQGADINWNWTFGFRCLQVFTLHCLTREPTNGVNLVRAWMTADGSVCKQWKYLDLCRLICSGVTNYTIMNWNRGWQGYQFLKSLVNCLYCTAYLPGL